MASFLPNPPTPIQELLTPITTIKYRSDLNDPREFHLSSNDGSFSFYIQKASPFGYRTKYYEEFDLFSTGAVREFYLNPSGDNPIAEHLPLVLKRLPALEALLISRAFLSSGSLLAFSSEPLLCQSLKTIAFFECSFDQEFITALEGIVAKRGHSTAARLHRVVFIGSRGLPDFSSIGQLQKFVPHVDVVLGNRIPYLL